MIAQVIAENLSEEEIAGLKEMFKMMDTDNSVTGPINIGNPNEFTIKQLAELVIELTGSKSQIVYQPAAQDDPQQRQPIIDKAKAILDWQPTVQLREGLEKTIEYFREIV